MKLFFILYTIMIVFLAGLLLFLMNKRQKRQFQEYQDRITKKHMEEMNGIHMTMRGFRHDYHNHMQKLKAHLALKQYEEAEGYLDSLEQELNQMVLRYKTGDVNLDAILNSKLSMAEKQHIAVNCKVELLRGVDGVRDVDLCGLIGNLLDNAMEACERIGQEERFIRVYICTKKKQLYISVSNATGERMRKWNHEFVTKKRGDHGQGLKRIDRIVEQYGGFINRKNEPGVFATEIMLPLQ